MVAEMAIKQQWNRAVIIMLSLYEGEELPNWTRWREVIDLYSGCVSESATKVCRDRSGGKPGK